MNYREKIKQLLHKDKREMVIAFALLVSFVALLFCCYIGWNKGIIACSVLTVICYMFHSFGNPFEGSGRNPFSWF